MKNRAAVHMGRVSAKKRRANIGEESYKKLMSENGKNGAKARWNKAKEVIHIANA